MKKNYNELNFLAGAYFSGKYALKSPASKYLMRRISQFMGRNITKTVYSTRLPISVNHAEPSDRAYYNDDFAAAVGL